MRPVVTMTDHKRIERAIRRSRHLAAGGTGLITAWWVTSAFGVELPWWGQAAVLSAGTIALLEAIHVRRNAFAPEPDQDEDDGDEPGTEVGRLW